MLEERLGIWTKILGEQAGLTAVGVSRQEENDQMQKEIVSLGPTPKQRSSVSANIHKLLKICVLHL